MLYLNKLLFFIVITAGLLGQACKDQSGLDYGIDKTSPSGVYHVRVESRGEKTKGTSKYTEHATVQFFKRQELVYGYVWENSDQYELAFRDTASVIEWVGNNVLRMGESTSDQPFRDEVVVLNNTDESLKYIGVSYGRYESFWVFDLASKSSVVLRASPRFKPDGTFNSYLGYSGVTLSGKKFEGTLEGKKDRFPTQGPLKLQISITLKDLR
jgi:hypothetical protein